MDGFWRDAWASFKATYGPVLTVGGFVLALVAFFVAPGATINFAWNWLILIVALGCVAVFVLGDMLATARAQASNYRSPKALSAFAGDTEGDTTPLTLVLEPSRALSPNVFVSIYHRESLAGPSRQDLERLIGVGRVATVTEGGLIQVVVLAELPRPPDVWRRIRGRDADTLRRILVKLSVPFGEAGVERIFNG